MALDDTKKSEGLDHEALRRMVDVAGEMTESSRTQSEQCRDYYDHQQLTSEELAVLKKRKQPALIINRIQRKVDAIVGIEQKGRVDPKALPRNPQDEDAADVATKALVFVDDIERFDVKRSAFCYNLAIEGTGGLEVTVQKNRDGTMDPKLVRLRWEEIFYDPYSRELDFSDAGYTGVQKWMTVENAIKAAQDFGTQLEDDVLREMLEGSFTTASGDTYEDRPIDGAGTHWGDKKTKRVRLAYMYYRRGNGWRMAMLCGGGLIGDQASPYYDEDGDPCNAMILQSCYIDRDNRRYGMVLGWIPMQDEINKRRSKALHMLNSRQTMGSKGAVADIAKMKRELALPDGHVEFDQDPQMSQRSFDVIPNADQLAGQFELLQESKAEIDMVGPNASLLGQMEGEQSGRAIIAQQQSGMAEIAPFYDNLRDWTIRVYRAVWNRVRQFWTEPRWIRVTDENERLQFIGINGAQNPDGTPGMQIAQLDVDIIVDMTPEYASLQIEQFQQIIELAKTGLVQFPPQIIIQASQLHNKSQIMQMFNDPAQQQEMQQQKQMAMEAAMAAIEEKKASAQLKQAQAQKTMVEAQTPQMGEPDTTPIEMEKIQSAERQTAAKLQADAEVKAAEAEKKRVEAMAILKELEIKQAEVALKGQDLMLRGQEVNINARKTTAEISRGDRQDGLAAQKLAIDANRGDRQDGLAEKKLEVDSKRGDRQDGISAKKVEYDAKAAGAVKRKRVLTPERDKSGRITRVIEEED